MKIINGNQFYLTNTINNLTLAVNENGTLIQETLQLEDGVVLEHQGLIFFMEPTLVEIFLSWKYSKDLG